MNDRQVGEEPPAPYGRRALAWFADLIMVGVVALLFTSLLHLPKLVSLALGQGPFPQVAPKQFVLFAVLFFVLYHTTSIWLTQSTAGKAMMGLRLHWASGGARISVGPRTLKCRLHCR